MAHSNEAVVAGFLGSTEYYENVNKGRSNRPDWIASLYQDTLHRAATGSEIQYWDNVLT